MATATALVKTSLTAGDLVELFGPIPLWRIRFDPVPGTATEKDVLNIHRRERRLCELVNGILVEKTGREENTSLTAADLVRLFGSMPLSRLRFNRDPGKATEQDVLRIYEKEKRLCELVNGILVEKTMGARESFLACWIIILLGDYCHPRNLGAILGADGMMRLAPGLLRIPDVSFISWDRLPGRRMTEEPIPDLCPDLAVEVLSPSNSRKEMKNKLKDFFNAGCKLVWFVDPRTRTVTVYNSVEDSRLLGEEQTLDGGDVLPRFSLPLRQLFGELDAH